MNKRTFPALLCVGSLVLVSACGKSKHDVNASSGPSASAAASPSVMPTVSVPGSPIPVAVPTLTWSGCDGGYQCASMQVPLDYSKPTGTKITIAVIRHHVKHATGVVVINPGGPGASGVDFAANGAPQVAAIRSNMDVVSFDPRGVGASTGVGCGHHLDAFVAQDSSPDNQAEINQLKAVSQQLADECLRTAGRAFLANIGTVDVAKDMDLLRAALGQDKLNYMGFSYGTRLGAAYMQLFPHNVGRFVLDGVDNPTFTSTDDEMQQGVAFENALDGLLAQCASQSSCAFKKGASATVQDEYDRLYASLDSHPLPAGGGRTLTQSLFFLGVALGLYDKGFWPQIEQGLHQAQKGNGSTLLSLADQYDERQSDGTYGSILGVYYAVSCVDRPVIGGVATLAKNAAEIKKRAPRMGPPIVWLDMPCAVWPVPPTGHPQAVHVPAGTGSHVVIIGTTRDPATPYESSVSLQKQIPGSHLLTWDGDGHTATGKSSCIDNLLAQWEVDGVFPPDGVRC